MLVWELGSQNTPNFLKKLRHNLILVDSHGLPKQTGENKAIGPKVFEP